MATQKQIAACRKARAAKKRKGKTSVGTKKTKSLAVKAKTRHRKGLGDVGSAVKSIVSTNKTAVKIVVGAAGAGAVFFLGRKIIGKIKESREANKVSDALKNIPLNSNNVTMSDAEATKIATSLLNSMNRFGTDEDTIKRIFENQIKTKDDFVLVQRQFGEVGYNQVTGRRNDKCTKLTLTDWLRAELSGKALEAIENRLTEWGILG